MWLSQLWLALGWITYGAIHSLLASRKCKEFISVRWPFLFRYYLVFYIFVAIVTMIPLLYRIWQMPGLRVWEPGTISRVAGLSTMLAGSLIMLMSLRIYFSSIRSFRYLFTSNGKPILLQRGLLKYTRHPIYLGTFLLIWGCFLIFPYGSILVTNIIITLYTLLGIRFEEKKLIGIFGDTYIAYKKAVPMIWPRFRSTTPIKDDKKQTVSTL